MIFNIFHLRSLKTRVTVFTLAVFLIGIWSLAFYASSMLREDMQRSLGDQQFSTVSLLAGQVNQELDERLRALEKIAGSFSPAILDNTATLQTLLEQRILLLSLFNEGIIAISADGTAIADVPLSAGRIGVNYMDRDFILVVLKEGKSMIGRPVMGKKLLAPLLVMAAPIRDLQGQVIGALMGATSLSLPNFLDKITENRYGKTGGYVLLIPKYRLIVMATDKSRIMESLPEPGINLPLDRFLQGYEGSDVYTNPLGVEVLGSAKQLPVSGWLMGVTLPTAEAFAPIRAMQQRMLLSAIFLTLLMGVLTWGILRRLLSPMLAAVRTLTLQSNSNQPLQPLPINSQDEIGELIAGFNHLLETLAQREEALQESEAKFRNFADQSLVGIYLLQDRVLKYVNPKFSKIFGLTVEQCLGLPFDKFVYPEDLHIVEENVRKRLSGEVKTVIYEFRGIRKNSEIVHLEIFGSSTLFNGKPAATGTLLDITEQKRVEEELLHLNETLEQRVAQEVEKNLKHELLLIHQNRLAAMGEMIGNIAHQWRQPLNALGLLIFNIKDAYRFNTLDAQYLDQAVADGRRMVEKMSTTISDFSNFFRPDKELVVFSAMKQIRDAIALVESSFLNSNITIHVDAPRDLNLSGFPNEYSQVLLNLLSNAKEAILAHNQPLPGRVDIILTKEVGQGCVSVRDNGGGIPEEILDRIFDPYFSTKNSGTGIGLYMSKMIIERNMKGSITVRNIEGAAEFVVASPLAAENGNQGHLV